MKSVLLPRPSITSPPAEPTLHVPDRALTCAVCGRHLGDIRHDILEIENVRFVRLTMMNCRGCNTAARWAPTGWRGDPTRRP